MIDFLASLDWRVPWWGLLALQPLFFWLLARRRRRRRLAGYADAHLLPWAVTTAPRMRGATWHAAANLLAWLLLAVAAAGPRLPLETAPGLDAPATRQHRISVQVLLDVSASMAAGDIAPARLTRAKLELDDWLARLSGERVGLIVYAGAAGVLLPASDDPALFRRALEFADASLIEQPGTRLGAALELAARQLQNATTRGKAILLVSDGDAGSLAGPAGEAARAAAVDLAKRGIPLFILGMGTTTGAPIPLPEGGYAERDGTQVQSRLDAGAYAELAHLGGGRFAQVADGDADWVELHDHGLATVPGDPPTPAQARAWRELYPWALAPALLLLMLGRMGRTDSDTPENGSGVPTGGFKLMSQWLLLGLLLSTPAAADVPPSAHALYQSGHYAQAQALFARQGGYAGQFGAGAAAWKLNDYRAAAAHFGAALLLARDARQRDDALYNLGNAHYGLGNWRAAVEAFTAVLLVRPRDASARANLEQARMRLARQGGNPFDSDLRGRRGQLAQGEVNLDWDSERAVRELEATRSEAMVGGTTAARARLQGVSGGVSGADLAAARLQSGLKKLELLGDRPQAMLKGLLRQDRGSPSEPGGDPW